MGASRTIKALLVDMDGVLWRGETPLEENIRGLKRLQERGLCLCFVTNNATRSRRAFAERIRRLGLEVSPDRVVTSASYIAARLRRAGIRRVLPVGEEGLLEELQVQGILPVEADPEAVVVGMDRGLSYDKLRKALRAILSGALFVGTNPDRTYPEPDGLSPGAGALLGFLEAASGIKPHLVGGKPGLDFIAHAVALTGEPPERVALVGDRLDTDILAARLAGLYAVLVLTGVTRPEEVPQKGFLRPDRVVQTLLDLEL